MNLINEISSLENIYLEMEKEIAEQSNRFIEQYDKIENPDKKIEFMLDQVLPLHIKGVLMMDRLNHLGWMKIKVNEVNINKSNKNMKNIEKFKDIGIDLDMLNNLKENQKKLEDNLSYSKSLMPNALSPTRKNLDYIMTTLNLLKLSFNNVFSMNKQLTKINSTLILEIKKLKENTK